LLGGLERQWPRLRAEEVEACDAVVVLGGYAHQRPGPGLRPEFSEGADRLMMGIELMEAGKGRVLVAETGAGWVRARLGGDRVIEFKKLQNTVEEMQEVRRLAGEHGWKKVALVTSAFHMQRAAGLARGQGLEVVAVAADWIAWMDETRVEDFVPRGEGLRKTETALREWMGLAYSLIRGQWRRAV
ncbi:MAG: YdcF family protein, partial [Acidobacteria bacterium]|nr:YdcF family protein [Acidobacteriota bacterium]